MTNLHETIAWLTVVLLIYLMASHEVLSRRALTDCTQSGTTLRVF
jgi:hypothetical protein